MPAKTWLGTTKAAKELDVTPKYLRENRLKLFKAGHHYRLINPTAARPTYKWHLERCEALLNKATRDAAKVESSQKAAIKGRGTQLPLVEGIDPYEIE